MSIWPTYAGLLGTEWVNFPVTPASLLPLHHYDVSQCLRITETTVCSCNVWWLIEGMQLVERSVYLSCFLYYPNKILKLFRLKESFELWCPHNVFNCYIYILVILVLLLILGFLNIFLDVFSTLRLHTACLILRLQRGWTVLGEFCVVHISVKYALLSPWNVCTRIQNLVQFWTCNTGGLEVYSVLFSLNMITHLLLSRYF